MFSNLLTKISHSKSKIIKLEGTTLVSFMHDPKGFAGSSLYS